MKTLLASLAVLGVAVTSQAQEPRRWLVQAEVQMVALPLPQAIALLPELRETARFSAAGARLQKMIASGEAELLGWPAVEGFATPRESQPKEAPPFIAKTEAAEEVRYPSEFEPPQIPYRFGRRQRIEIIGGPPLWLLRAPTALDSRLAGPRLELVGSVDEQRHLLLQTKAEFDWLVAIEPTLGARGDRIDSPTRIQPRFRELRAEATLRVDQELRTLLGAFSDGRAQPRMVLFLLHVSFQPAPPPL